MAFRKLHGGKLRAADYDETARQLTIEFTDRDVKCFKNVPPDVYRRLLSAPNPATFYEDRIEEEYAVVRGERQVDTERARSDLDDLFGS